MNTAAPAADRETTANEHAESSVAQAIDRVLESEQAAQAAVESCRHECDAALERARQQRRSILERAQARIAALHARAAAALARRTAEIIEAQRHLAAQTTEQLADTAHRRAALERLAAQLTGPEDGNHDA